MSERTRDLAWLAGLLEGEGCFHLALRLNQDQKPRISIRVGMTDGDVVERVWRIAGVGRQPRLFERPAPLKNVFTWNVTGQSDAASLMMTLYPLMGERRQEKIRECLVAWRAVPIYRGTGERGATHCPQGHEKSGDNLYVDHEGKRHCKICRKASYAAYKARQRAKL
jgi:hypothetical protein